MTIKTNNFRHKKETKKYPINLQNDCLYLKGPRGFFSQTDIVCKLKQHFRNKEKFRSKNRFMNETELLIEYAKCWNNLDVSYIEELLGDDLEYTSQWVFETMYGKDNYLQYLSGKFNTIRNSINIPKAELG